MKLKHTKTNGNTVEHCSPAGLISVLTLVSFGCADIVGIEAGVSSASACKSSQQCAPSETCFKSRCLMACRDPGDCLSSERCENHACVPTGERCLTGDRRCHEFQPQVCGDDSAWSDDGAPCLVACKKGSCLLPNSCRDRPTCGVGADSCCATDPVPGGDFELTYEVRTNTSTIMSVSRTVEPFALDRFEVTASRFYLFLTAYGAARSPPDDAGARPGLPGSGWRPEWSDDPALMAPSADSLQKGITACGSWRGLDDGQLPMHCVNWYVAMAFCIWDGGRLPSEAEWAFAAMEGNAHRKFPWSSNADDGQVDQEHACYQDDDHAWDDRQPVGERPAGVGAFGQHDLAGNVLEWTADAFQRELNADDCTSEDSRRSLADCLTQQITSTRVQRGGSYASGEHALLNTSRTNDVAARRDATVGFRCARDWN